MNIEQQIAELKIRQGEILAALTTASVDELETVTKKLERLIRRQAFDSVKKD